MSLVIIQQDGKEIGSGLREIGEQARQFAQAAYSSNTARAYEGDWRDFVSFCECHGLSFLPASPATLAAYITERSKVHKVATLERRLAAITTRHNRAGLHIDTLDPIFRDTWRGIRKTKGRPQARKEPVLIDMLTQIVEQLPDTLLGLRDKALMLLGFSAALRRSELAALKTRDIRFAKEGLVITVGKSKTDQEGQGRNIAIPYARNQKICAARAVEGWIRATGRKDDEFLFCSVGRNNQPKASISTKMVALIIKKLVLKHAMAAGATREEAINFANEFGGHSLRAGFATSAAEAGVEERLIANQTGHKSMPVLRRYIRQGNLFRNHALNLMGM